MKYRNHHDLLIPSDRIDHRKWRPSQMAAAIPSANRSPSFRKAKDALHRHIHFIQKISTQSGNSFLIKRRRFPNFGKCGSQEPVIHRRNSLRNSASAFIRVNLVSQIADYQRQIYELFDFIIDTRYGPAGLACQRLFGQRTVWEVSDQHVSVKFFKFHEALGTSCGRPP